MPHIFFERLENRRSTQTFFMGSPTWQIGDYQTLPDMRVLYGMPPAMDEFTGGYWGQIPNISYPAWDYSLNQYSQWVNPVSNLFDGISSLFSPLWNTSQSFFDWRSPAWSNTYTGQGQWVMPNLSIWSPPFRELRLTKPDFSNQSPVRIAYYAVQIPERGLWY